MRKGPSIRARDAVRGRRSSSPRGGAAGSLSRSGGRASSRPGMRGVPHGPPHCRRRAAHPKLPLVPGHEIVGTVEQVGASVAGLKLGDRVGVPWLGWTCGACDYCRSGRENLCDTARFTGYQIDGGYAELRGGRSPLLLPDPSRPPRRRGGAAPVRGLIGYRCLSKAGPGERLGLYGFGAAAPAGCLPRSMPPGSRVFAFTRPGERGGPGLRGRSAPHGPATRTGGLPSPLTPRSFRSGRHARPAPRSVRS